MKLKLFFTALIVAFTFPFFGQIEGTMDSFNEDFWSEKPALTTLTEEEKKSNAVYISDVNICKYEYGTFIDPKSGTLYDDVLIEENLYYKRIRLNNDNAVETFNKVYISMSNSRDVINLRARAITKNGEIIEFNDSNRKEVDNYENYGPFTILLLRELR